MDVTHTLLSLPIYLLLTVMIIFFGGIGMIITSIVHRFTKIKILNAHNEVTGYVFSVVAGFYALILAFVVFQALDEFNGVQRDADIEGSLARSLYRQIKYYPDTAVASSLKKDYLDYVNLVVNDEYPNMANMEKSQPTVVAFSNIFERIEKLDPDEKNTQDKAMSMMGTLNELAKNRNLRNLAGDSEIPFVMWLPLLLGWIITMIFAAMIHAENQRYHIILNGLMGVFAGLIFFLIIILDHPFAGSMKVEPKSYENIIQLDASSNLKK